MSCSAWQSVSTSTGYLYTMLANLSKEYFSAANLSRKGLYFFLDDDVRFDVKPIGCNRVTSFPPGNVDLIFCERTPANASLHAFVIRIKCVLSKWGAVSTGSETNQAFKFTKVAVCSSFQCG